MEAVLIVDDSLTVRMDLADVFERAGFRPVVCTDLTEARSALAAGRIALVILDVLLPDGDGLDLLREIRATPATADVPVMMLSFEAEVKDRIRGLQTGATDYVGKPYDRGQLVSRARSLLRGTPTQAAAAQEPTVLVVDDSATFREELAQALRKAGYLVITAESGEQGLRLASDHRPSAIIVDGVMPDIDGQTVVRRIRVDSALRGIPCLLLTASDSGKEELQALDAGADAFVRKSDDLDLILARLGAVLRAAGVRRDDATPLFGPKRILAVDDSKTYLHALAGILQADGYDVVLAESGEEAIEMLAVQPVDCILLDLLMPGLGGKETCRQIKASPEGRDIPLIMLTAIENRDAMIDGLGMGADDYISKGSDFEVLKARLRAQLRRKQFEDEHRRVRDELLRSEVSAAEARAARLVAEAKAVHSEELARKNRELETFSYSVSHDLRTPLRGIDGFSQALIEHYGSVLDERGQKYLRRIRSAAQRMGELIDDLLHLSRLGRTEINLGPVDLAGISRGVVADLQRLDPQRQVTFVADETANARADRRLIQIVLENLIGNAWKFTAKTPGARIEFRTEMRDGVSVFLLRDNGAGFDQAYADKLFAPFQRLHAESDFAGTGIGLATVHRIIDRHNGRVWAEAEVGKGATFFFSLSPSPPAPSNPNRSPSPGSGSSAA